MLVVAAMVPATRPPWSFVAGSALRWSSALMLYSVHQQKYQHDTIRYMSFSAFVIEHTPWYCIDEQCCAMQETWLGYRLGFAFVFVFVFPNCRVLTEHWLWTRCHRGNWSQLCLYLYSQWITYMHIALVAGGTGGNSDKLQITLARWTGWKRKHNCFCQSHWFFIIIYNLSFIIMTYNC